MNDFERMCAKREKKMQDLEDLSSQMSQLLDALKAGQDRLSELYDWYFNGNWLADRDYEENHPLPENQSSGIFSEDGLYNLFQPLDEQCEDLRTELNLWQKLLNPNDSK